MTPAQALSQHQAVCDELHALALEENSFLQQHRHAPGADFMARKRTLIDRLEAVLAALRSAPKGALGESSLKSALTAAQSRVLQILQLERENEQLLLRGSLSRSGIERPTLSAATLNKIYRRSPS
jgi:hypothetical protein